MIVAESSFTRYQPSSNRSADIEEMARHGAHAVFGVRPTAISRDILHRLERRDRVVLMLLDGKRSIQDIAALIHRSELEVARILVRLLKQGYIEFLGA